MITPRHKERILSIVNIFETGSPHGDYGKITVLPDGPGSVRQITYGRTQTTEYGNLPTLLAAYASHPQARYGREIEPFLEQLGTSSLHDNIAFLGLLEKSGTDPVMRTLQDTFFDIHYYQPAYRWFEMNEFLYPLSLLVIYDSYVHSGGIHWFLRARFSEPLPSRDGAEEMWTRNYVQARHQWLSDHSRTILQKTVYRTAFFKELLRQGDWDLAAQEYEVNGVLCS